MIEIDWRKVPKQALVDALRNTSLGPSNLSRQDKADLIAITKDGLRSSKGENLRRNLETEIAFRSKKKTKVSTPSIACQQAASLSDHVVSRLIGRNRYNPIDRARLEFVVFIDGADADAGRPVYDSWQDAWAVFKHSTIIHGLMHVEPPADE